MGDAGGLNWGCTGRMGWPYDPMIPWVIPAHPRPLRGGVRGLASANWAIAAHAGRCERAQGGGVGAGGARDNRMVTAQSRGRSRRLEDPRLGRSSGLRL